MTFIILQCILSILWIFWVANSVSIVDSISFQKKSFSFVFRISSESYLHIQCSIRSNLSSNEKLDTDPHIQPNKNHSHILIIFS